MKKLYILLILIFYNYFSFGQVSPSSVVTGHLITTGPKLTTIKYNGPVPRDVGKFSDVQIEDHDEEAEEIRENFDARVVIPNKGAKSIDQAIQKTFFMIPSTPLPLIQSFDGVGTVDNVALYGGSFVPPDPNLCVGPNHVVMMVNSAHKVFDKSGTILSGPLKFSSIAPGAGDDGDPIVLYDHIADRYLLLQFDVTSGVDNNSLIFCISQTNDPTGAYNVYKFPTPGVFPDYPHVGIWGDSYIVTTHEFNIAATSYVGQGFYAVDRKKMVEGSPTATLIRFQDSNQFGFLPASFEGRKTPETNSDPLFVSLEADEFGDINDAYILRTLHYDFTTPSNSTLSGVTRLFSAAFDPRSPNGRGDVDQPGTTVGLDAITGRMMSRIIYRRFDNYESLVMNHAVNVSGVAPNSKSTFQAAMRWVELTRPTPVSNWSINQESSFSPDAGNGSTGFDRWMGSTGIDQRGNMASAYSRSSINAGAPNFPGIYYNERRKTDALGTMSSEAEFFASGGSQTSTSNRWGDYTSMTTDPTDEETLWYTNEYYDVTSSGSWKTRIGSFKVNDPLTGPTVHFKLGGTIARQKEALPTFKDYLIDIVIDNAPTQPINITLSKSGTATEGVDYDLLNISSLVLNASNLTQQFTLRVYNNPIAEPDEFVNIEYTLNFNGGNGVAGAYNQKHRVTIIGLPDCPEPNVASTTICTNQSVSLIASCSSGSLNWYDATGTTLLSTTSPYVTPVLNSTTVYKARCVDVHCTGNFVDVTVTRDADIVMTSPTITQPTCASPTGSIVLNVPNGISDISINGINATTDPTQNGRLARTNVVSTCTANPYPGIFNSNILNYDIFSFTNTTASPVCVTTNVTSGSSTNLFFVNYLNSFNPASIGTNYLGDPGGSSLNMTCSQTLPAGATMVTDVHNISVGVGGGAYTLNISSPNALEYSINNGTSWQNSNSFTGLTSGSYNALVRKKNTPSCSTPFSGNPIIITSPLGLIAGSNSPICESSTLNLTSSGAVNYSWTGPNSFSSALQNPSITLASVAASGIYTVTANDGAGCSATSTVSVTVNSAPTAIASSNSPVNVGGSINLTSSGGASYSWSGPNSFSSAMQNPSIASASIAMAGIYTVTVTSASSCTATAIINVVVNNVACVPPTSPTASSNSPICVGNTLNLSSSGGSSYSWSGPNSFSSSMQNPSISTVTTSSSGVYTVTISNGVGCSATATTSAIVNSLPFAGASSNSPICAGNSLNLFYSVPASPQISVNTFSWSGPNLFSSSDQNPQILSATTLASGIYTLTVTGGTGCTATATTSATVNAIPTATAGSNSPVNVAGTINLTSSGGTSYSWTGPNSFSSAMQNPTIASATLAMAGVYTVTVNSASSCTATATTNVEVNSGGCVPPTSPMASSNSPICAGNALNLSSSGGSSYSWAGPNLFSSTTQNPSISAATTAASGVYTVTVSNGVGCSATATTSVIVNSLPFAGASSNSPICAGNTLNLFYSAPLSPQLSSNTFSWTGPNLFSSSDQNPQILSATTLASGIYTLTVTGGTGCTATATTSATVNAIPTASISGIDNLNCTLTTVSRTASGGVSYVWSPGLETTATLNISSPGNYTVTVTGSGGCTATATTSVSQNIDPPSVSISGSDNLSCAMPIVTRTAIGTGTYLWSNGLGTNATVSISNAGTYTVTVTASNGCTATATTSVTSGGGVFSGTVTSHPISSTICQGNHTTFSTSATGTGISYVWQVNKGSGFVDIIADGNFSNETSPTLLVTFPPVAMNGYQFRCKISDVNCSVNTNVANLTVQIAAEAITIVNISPINSDMAQQAVSFIVALNQVNAPAKVQFFAGNAIDLIPGFEAKLGSTFTAKIQNACSSSMAGPEGNGIPNEIVK